MNEYDLPCTDCGTVLIESTVPAGLLPVNTTYVGEITIGICPDCGARYYPDDTLQELTTNSRHQPNNNHA